LSDMYNELYEAWKKEKENKELQTFSRDFYSRLTDYVKSLREESRMLDRKALKARLMLRELENVKKLTKELVQLRYKKTLNETITGKVVPGDVLTEEEEGLHKAILPLAESYKAFLKDILRGHSSPVKREEKPKRMLLRFLQDIPAVIGSDMRTYGPFKAEDIATLPIENARIFLEKGIAVEVEAKV
jgi:DNA replication factor GINS